MGLKISIKEIFDKIKRQSIKWENMFANHVSVKELILKHIRNFYNSMVKLSIG